MPSSYISSEISFKKKISKWIKQMLNVHKKIDLENSRKFRNNNTYMIFTQTGWTY